MKAIHFIIVFSIFVSIPCFAQHFPAKVDKKAVYQVGNLEVQIKNLYGSVKLDQGSNGWYYYADNGHLIASLYLKLTNNSDNNMSVDLNKIKLVNESGKEFSPFITEGTVHIKPNKSRALILLYQYQFPEGGKPYILNINRATLQIKWKEDN